MLHNVELTAAPHLPHALRSIAERHLLADFVLALNGDLDLALVEDNGELRFVSYPNVTE